MEDKQIEEMATICCGSNITCSECFEEFKKVMNIKINKKSEHCQAYNYAEKLYNEGYRKIHKNAVVITNEKLELGEYKGETQVMNMTRKTYDAMLSQERKQTAKEILEYLMHSFFLTDKHKFFVKKWIKEQYKLEEELWQKAKKT